MIDGSKLHALVDKLYDLTSSKRLEWQEDPHGNDAPWVKLGDNFIVLREGRNASGSALLKVSIEDANEKVLYQFNDEDLDDTSTTKYFDKLTELFSAARRQASGVDATLDDILKNLDRLG